MATIKNQNTLEQQITPPSLSTPYEVYFTSNPSANYFDASAPYAEHDGVKITIHGYLAVPLFGSGPFPALVIGHGHGGQADPNLAQAIAVLYQYVVLAIDGPQAGKSTGGPKDDNQAWISVDKGPQYSYLYHYAYAGMRALTLLELLAKDPDYKIDANRLGVIGASMGGLFATYINGIDDRVKAAVALSAAGNWHHSLRYPNGWLYHGVYTGTRDMPYNGNDPINSIENVDTDSTAITFFDYFDPIRYAPTQHAPLLTVMGTHDEYFPLPEANLTEQAIESAGTQSNFEKRLWLIPNAMHGLSTSSSSASASLVDVLTNIAPPLLEWLNYCFGGRDRPLATPTVSMTDTGSGLGFEVAVPQSATKTGISQVDVYVASRIDSTVVGSNPPVRDFTDYRAALQNGVYVARLPGGEKSSSGDVLTTDNAIYFATVKDSGGLMVSSLVYKGSRPIDLSTTFTPGIDQYPGDTVVAPPPPPYTPAAKSLASSVPAITGSDYQGMSLTNPTANPMSVRVDAYSADGRIAAAQGLINPVFMTLPPFSQRIFLAEEWFGPGALQFNGSFGMGWSDTNATALAFRGKGSPSQLDEIGPMSLSPAPQWLPLAPDQDPAATRTLRIFEGAGSGPTDVTVSFFDAAGKPLGSQTVTPSASGTADIPLAAQWFYSTAAYARIESSASLAARLEASGNNDPWSIEARTVPSGVATLIQPHVEINGTFTTRLIALNTSSSPRSVIYILHAPLAAPQSETRDNPAGSL